MGVNTLSYSDSSSYQPPSSGPRERPQGPSPIRVRSNELTEHEDAQAQADAIGVKARHVQSSPSRLSVLMGMVGSNSGLLGKAAQALAKSRAAAEGKIPPN